MDFVIQTVILILSLSALTALSYLLKRLLVRMVKKEWLCYLLLAPGTVIHELCHWLACEVTFTPVIEVHLFRPVRQPNGTVQLGQVEHGDGGPVRNFFIAIAPLLGASGLIYLISRWLLPENLSFASVVTSGWTYLFLPIVFLVSLGLAPSSQDMKALPSFLVAVMVLVIAVYVLVQYVPESVDLSGFADSVLSALKTTNGGLLLILPFVVFVSGIVVLARWIAGRHQKRIEDDSSGQLD